MSQPSADFVVSVTDDQAAADFTVFIVGGGGGGGTDLSPTGTYVTSIDAWGEPGFVDPGVGDDSHGWIAMIANDSNGDVTVGYGDTGEIWIDLEATPTAASIDMGYQPVDGETALIHIETAQHRAIVIITAQDGQTQPLLDLQANGDHVFQVLPDGTGRLGVLGDLVAAVNANNDPGFIDPAHVDASAGWIALNTVGSGGLYATVTAGYDNGYAQLLAENSGAGLIVQACDAQSDPLLQLLDITQTVVVEVDHAGFLKKLGPVAPNPGDVLTWIDADTAWEPLHATRSVGLSSGRPGSPVIGDEFFETDTGNTLYWYGGDTEWAPAWNTGWGELEEVTWATATVGTNAGFTDVDGGTVTFDAVAGRKYRYTVRGFSILTGLAVQLVVSLTDPGNTDAVPEWALPGSAAGFSFDLVAEEGSIDAGSTTRKLRVQWAGASGGGQFYADGSISASLAVEDIGPTGPPS